MDYQEMIWELDAEGYRHCEICGENKVTAFKHDVCKECHDEDTSQCEECNPRSVK